jgi:excisionase family DNA binding protein
MRGLKMDKQFYTAKEASEILRIDIKTLYKSLHRGGIKAIRVGRCWRIPVSELEVDSSGNEQTLADEIGLEFLDEYEDVNEV